MASTKRFSASVTIGGALAGSFKSMIGQTRMQLGTVGNSIGQLASRQRELNRTIADQERLGRAGNALRVQFAQQELDVIGKQITALKERERVLAKGAQMRADGKSAMASGGLMIGAAVAAAATLGRPIKLAADFETAMAGIAKQVQGARDENGKLTPTYYEMGEAIKKMARETPIAANQLAGMVTAAARMGIAKDDLLDFTRIAVQMATAFEVADPAELAERMGKISTLYKVNTRDMVKLGDTINKLDDEGLSKAPEIIDFMQRVGGVAGSVKIGADQMATLGSTLLSLGERAETAGTATNAIFQKFAAAEKGTKKFRQALAEIGLNATEIQKGMQIDAQGTLLQVLAAINKMPADKRLGIGVELVGMEHSDTLAKLAANVEEYNRQIEVSKQGAGSMAREYQAQLQTMNTQFKLLGQTLTEIGVDIGTTMLPAMQSIVGTLKSASGAVSDFAKEHPELMRNVLSTSGVVIGLTAALGVGRLAFGGIGYALGAIPPLVTAAGTAFTWMAGTAIPAVVAGIRAIGLAVAANPIGAVVTGLVAGAALVAANWETVTKVFRGVGDAIGSVWSKAKSVFGFTSGTASTGGQRPAIGAPPMPTMRAGGANVTNNVTNAPTITINQQPGQDSKGLVAELRRELERQNAVAARGRMYDAALGY